MSPEIASSVPIWIGSPTATRDAAELRRWTVRPPPVAPTTRCSAGAGAAVVAHARARSARVRPRRANAASNVRCFMMPPPLYRPSRNVGWLVPHPTSPGQSPGRTGPLTPHTAADAPSGCLGAPASASAGDAPSGMRPGTQPRARRPRRPRPSRHERAADDHAVGERAGRRRPAPACRCPRRRAGGGR